MTKLIDIKILNNTLFLKFENKGYIKVKNINAFNLQIADCPKDLNYFELFKTSFDDVDYFEECIKPLLDKFNIKYSDFPNVDWSKYSEIRNIDLFNCTNDYYFESYDWMENRYNHKHRLLICSNGRAILLRLYPKLKFVTPFQALQNIIEFLKENFKVRNVKEILTDYKNVELELKDIFIEFREIYEAEQAEKKRIENKKILESKQHQRLCYLRDNQELLFKNLKEKISASDYDLVLAYSCYNFSYLKKPSKALRDCVYNYIAHYLRNVLNAAGFDTILYGNLLKYFAITNCKKVLLKFDAEQIGPDHDKKWQISNFSFSTINN